MIVFERKRSDSQIIWTIRARTIVKNSQQSPTRYVQALDTASRQRKRPHIVGSRRVYRQKSISMLPLTAFSPALAPCDLSLFPNLQTDLTLGPWITPRQLRRGVSTALLKKGFPSAMNNGRSRWVHYCNIVYFIENSIHVFLKKYQRF